MPHDAQPRLASSRLIACLLFAGLWSPAWTVSLVSEGLSAGERASAVVLALWMLMVTPVLLGSVRASLLAWLPAACLLPPYLFLCVQFRSPPGDALVAAALHTAPALSLQVLRGFGAWLWAWAGLALAYGLLAWRIDPRLRWGAPRRKAWLAVLLGVAALSLVLRQALPQQLSLPPLFERSTADRVFPLSLALSVDRVLAHDRSPPVHVSLHGRPKPGTAQEPLHLVLVLGETVRPDHLGIYGYARDTTPGLSAISQELLLFTDVASTAHWTDGAVPGIVKRGIGNMRQASLLRTMKEGGYRTAWLSNQEASQLADGADVADFPHGSYDLLLRMDDVLLPPFEALLRQAGPRQFIGLHMIGSHFPYEERYDAKARRFTPTLADVGVSGHPSPANKAETINSYDNTLIALDSFLMRAIRALAADPVPALLVYTSDHGENLFDDDRQRFMHALADPSRADTTVPLFIWANEAWHRRWPQGLAPLVARRNLPISHVDLMPTLLDLAGVDADGLGAQESLRSPHWQPHPRRLRQFDGPGWDYDRIR